MSHHHNHHCSWNKIKCPCCKKGQQRHKGKKYKKKLMTGKKRRGTAAKRRKGPARSKRTGRFLRR